jgi:hypothetical protein
MAELAPPAALEPWELVAAKETSARASHALAGDGNHGKLAGCNGSGGLARLDTLELTSSRAAPGESTDSQVVHDDASEADTRERQAAIGEGVNGTSQASAAAADEVPDQAGRVPDARGGGPEEADDLLTAQSMQQRSRRMFTGGAGEPAHSRMGTVAEPATNELLILVDDAANELFDAEERGELQLTAGPLDRIDARGYLLADVVGRTYTSAEDAATVGKRAQEHVNSKKAGVRKDLAAIEKAAYLKVYKARAAAAKGGTIADAVAQKVKTIETEAETQVAALMSKTYMTLFKDISLKRKRVSALPPQPSVVEFRGAWSEVREAEAAWLVACDTRACAGEKQDTAASNLENFWERVKDKRRISDSQEAVLDRLVARFEAAAAAFESAEERLAAAKDALEQATEKLTHTRDAVMAGYDPDAEPTLQTLEYLKISEAVCCYLTSVYRRQQQYADARAREAEEEIAEHKSKRKRSR